MEQKHTTDPEYYDGEKLSEEASEHRASKEQGLDALYTELREMDAAEEKPNPIIRMKLLRKIDLVEQDLAWQGANPKDVPFADLKAHVQGAHGADSIENKYRARIRNRATAIRAYCVMCMGGDTVGVRECQAITCPLHPFRMGKDPLRGWDIPKVEMPELETEDEEDTGAFEEGDEGNEADAKE